MTAESNKKKAAEPRKSTRPVKSSETKHGNGDTLTEQQIEDAHQRRYRQWRSRQVFTSTHLWVVAGAAVAITMFLMYLTDRWVGL